MEKRLLLQNIRNKKRRWCDQQLHAGQPVNADGSTGGVAPELNELFYGEDAGQVFDTAAILGMSFFELVISPGISGDPSDVGNADHIAVEIGLDNPSAASWGAVNIISI